MAEKRGPLQRTTIHANDLDSLRIAFEQIQDQIEHVRDTSSKSSAAAASSSDVQAAAQASASTPVGIILTDQIDTTGAEIGHFMRITAEGARWGALTVFDVPEMQGATTSAQGEKGLVPRPVAGDDDKFLRGDGTWADVASASVATDSTLTGDGRVGTELGVNLTTEGNRIRACVLTGFIAAAGTIGAADTILQAFQKTEYRLALNDAKVSFPGFGTSHVTAAYGDHTHSGVYEPAITAGTSSQVWKGNKAWGSVAWSELSGAPSSFTPSAHSHAISDVTGLQAALDGKVATTDPRLSDARPASDVYAWAKAATKPAYTAAEVGALATGGTAYNADRLGTYLQDLQTVVGDGDYLLVRNQTAGKISLASAASVAAIVQGAATGTWNITAANADTLDGYHASAFAQLGQNANFAALTVGGNITVPATGQTFISNSIQQTGLDIITTSGSERVRLFAANNLGLTIDKTGAATFAGDLNISSGAANANLNLKNTAGPTGFTLQLDSAGDVYVWQRQNRPMYFGTNGTTALTIAANQSATFASSVTASASSGAQGIFTGFGGGVASALNGEILLGNTEAYRGRISMDAATGSTTMRFDSTYDSAAAEMHFRFRTASSAVIALKLKGDLSAIFGGAVTMGPLSSTSAFIAFSSAYDALRIGSGAAGSGMAMESINVARTGYVPLTLYATGWNFHNGGALVASINQNGALTASGNITSSYNAAGNVSVVSENLNTAANSTAQIIAKNDVGRSLRIQKGSSNASSQLLAGGPAGECAVIFTDSAHPLVLGTNGSATLTLDGATRGATFASSVSMGALTATSGLFTAATGNVLAVQSTTAAQTVGIDFLNPSRNWRIQSSHNVAGDLVIRDLTAGIVPLSFAPGTGVATFSSTVTFGDAITVSSTTDSISTATGALIVSGGIGCDKTIRAKGYIFAGNNTILYPTVIGANSYTTISWGDSTTVGYDSTFGYGWIGAGDTTNARDFHINPMGGRTKVCGQIGFNNTTPIAKPTVTGSRGGNAALASLLTSMSNYGLITDSTTA